MEGSLVQTTVDTTATRPERNRTHVRPSAAPLLATRGAEEQQTGLFVAPRRGVAAGACSWRHWPPRRLASSLGGFMALHEDTSRDVGSLGARGVAVAPAARSAKRKRETRGQQFMARTARQLAAHYYRTPGGVSTTRKRCHPALFQKAPYFSKIPPLSAVSVQRAAAPTHPPLDYVLFRSKVPLRYVRRGKLLRGF